jgi:hypothetical protein
MISDGLIGWEKVITTLCLLGLICDGRSLGKNNRRGRKELKEFHKDRPGEHEGCVRED